MALVGRMYNLFFRRTSTFAVTIMVGAVVFERVFDQAGDAIFDHLNHGLMALSRKLLGQRLFEKLMKKTFYGHFVAGEDQESIKPQIQKIRAFGVGSFLECCAEQELPEDEVKNKGLDSRESRADAEVDASEFRERKYQAHQPHGGHQGGSVGGRTYFYDSEVKCDDNMETYLKCIRDSGGSTEDGFCGIMMSALGRPQFLIQFSEVLVKWKKFFQFLAMEQGKGNMEALKQSLDLERLQDSLSKLGVGTKDDIMTWFSEEKFGSTGTIDRLDWNRLINNRTRISNQLLVPNMETGQLEPLLSNFTKEEEQQMKRMLQRVDVLAKHAEEHGVRLMMNAEQSYFQPANSHLTVAMQRIFNREKPVIFNTYQCYLKEAYDNVSLDVERSRREGWLFGAKLVRGAYMYQERRQAAKFGYEDPINPDYETTNRMYSKCLDCILEEIRHNRRANVMVASHNEDTIKHTVQRMTDMGLSPKENTVYFAQLWGMCDHISFPLGRAGFAVYKYIVYGPVNQVLPYLTRRAQENRSLLQRSERERRLVWRELKRRLLTGQILYRPAF
ncbi:hypothetical protein GJAV_G00039850 [Gymnothorax javanicus]|nr:hypothetical protein GJAV_G00039850 [Gymnothorax javanicus]